MRAISRNQMCVPLLQVISGSVCVSALGGMFVFTVSYILQSCNVRSGLSSGGIDKSASYVFSGLRREALSE